MRASNPFRPGMNAIRAPIASDRMRSVLCFFLSDSMDSFTLENPVPSSSTSMTRRVSNQDNRTQICHADECLSEL